MQPARDNCDTSDACACQIRGTRGTRGIHDTRSARNAWPVAASLLLAAAPAQAHLVSTSLGPVYDSVFHWLTSPEGVAPVIGLALFAGVRGPQHARRALFALTGAWLAGAFFASAWLAGTSLAGTPLAGAWPAGTWLAVVRPVFAPWAGFAASLWTAGACLSLGGLLAADVKLPVATTTCLAVTVGVVGGVMDAATQATAGGAAAMLSVCATVFVVTALTASLVVPLQMLWLRLAVRLAGSWMAALGLLLMGWAIRTRS